jgi:solute carrier family 25 protein 44
MVMATEKYAIGGSAASVARSIVETEGYSGLYKGFGLSIISSLPTGSIWWAIYGGCQHAMDALITTPPDGDEYGALIRLAQRGLIQLFSGVGAALVAALVSHPIDVVKTRLQVGSEANDMKTSSTSTLAIARELAAKFGSARLLPRVRSARDALESQENCAEFHVRTAAPCVSQKLTDKSTIVR